MITLTATANVKLKEIIAERQMGEAYLRLYVAPGGCSGFSYGMGLEETPGADDQVFEREGIRVLVDPASLGYLDGAEVDYVDGLMGAGFTIHNPNATSTCGCGSSFKTAKESGQAKPCC